MPVDAAVAALLSASRCTTFCFLAAPLPMPVDAAVASASLCTTFCFLVLPPPMPVNAAVAALLSASLCTTFCFLAAPPPIDAAVASALLRLRAAQSPLVLSFSNLLVLPLVPCLSLSRTTSTGHGTESKALAISCRLKLVALSCAPLPSAFCSASFFEQAAPAASSTGLGCDCNAFAISCRLKRTPPTFLCASGPLCTHAVCASSAARASSPIPR